MQTQKRLVSFIMQSLHHAMRRWVWCNIEWQSRQFASAEHAFHPGAGQWSGSQSPYQRRMLQGVPFTIDCSSLAQTISFFRQSRADFDLGLRAIHSAAWWGPDDIREEADRADRADRWCRDAQEGQWPPADLSQPQGEDVGQLRPRAHSSAHFLLGLQHGWLKGAFVHWFLSVSTNQNITLRYFKLNVSRHHIERISLHRLYRLPRPFEVLVFSDGYGYCKDILQQALIVSMGPKFKGRRNEETCCLHLIYVMCVSTQPVYIYIIYNYIYIYCVIMYDIGMTFVTHNVFSLRCCDRRLQAALAQRVWRPQCELPHWHWALTALTALTMSV